MFEQPALLGCFLHLKPHIKPLITEVFSLFLFAKQICLPKQQPRCQLFHVMNALVFSPLLVRSFIAIDPDSDIQTID